MRQIGTNVSLALWISLVLIKLSIVRGAERRFACWGSFGPPVVSAQCPRDTIIHVTRAGLKVQSKPGECQFNEEDCGCEYGEAGCQMPNVANLCIGKPACKLDVTQQYIITDRCRGFSGYMYIDFDCVPVEKSVEDICAKVNVEQNVGLLRSPNYPQQLSGSTDCQCSLSPAQGKSMLLSIVEMHVVGAECVKGTLNVQFNGGVTPLCDKSDGYTQKLGHGHIPIYLSLKTTAKPDIAGFLLKYEGEENSTVAIRCGSAMLAAPGHPPSEQVIKAWTPPDIKSLFKVSRKPPERDREFTSSRFIEVPTIKPYLHQIDNRGRDLLSTIPVTVEKAAPMSDRTGSQRRLLKSNHLLNPVKDQPRQEIKDEQSSQSYTVLPKIELDGIHPILRKQRPSADIKDAPRRQKISRQNFVPSPFFPKPTETEEGLYSNVKMDRLGPIEPVSLLGRTGLEERSSIVKKVQPVNRRMPADSILLTTEKATYPTFETQITNDDVKNTLLHLPILRKKNSNAKIIRRRVGAPIEILPTIPPSSDKLRPTNEPWWWKFTAKSKATSYESSQPLNTPVHVQQPAHLSHGHPRLAKYVKSRPKSNSHAEEYLDIPKKNEETPALQQKPIEDSIRDENPSSILPGKSAPAIPFLNRQSPLSKPGSSPITKHDLNLHQNNYLDEYAGTHNTGDYNGNYEITEVEKEQKQKKESPNSIDDSNIDYDFIDLMEKVPFEQEKLGDKSNSTKILDYDPIPLHEERTKNTKAPFMDALDPIALDAETERIKNKNNVVPFIVAQDPIPLHDEPKSPKQEEPIYQYGTESTNSDEYEYYYYDEYETESPLDKKRQNHNDNTDISKGKGQSDDMTKMVSNNILLKDFLERKLRPNKQDKKDENPNLRSEYNTKRFSNRGIQENREKKHNLIGLRSENYKISVGIKRPEGKNRIRPDRRRDNLKKTDQSTDIKRWEKKKDEWIDLRSEYDKKRDQRISKGRKNIGSGQRVAGDYHSHRNSGKGRGLRERNANNNINQVKENRANSDTESNSPTESHVMDVEDQTLHRNKTDNKEKLGTSKGIIRGNDKAGDNQKRKKPFITEKESTMVTIIAAGVIGGIVLIVVLGVVVRFIMNRSNPQHALRQHHKRECVIRRNGHRMMLARKGKPFAKSYS